LEEIKENNQRAHRASIRGERKGGIFGIIWWISWVNACFTATNMLKQFARRPKVYASSELRSALQDQGDPWRRKIRAAPLSVVALARRVHQSRL